MSKGEGQAPPCRPHTVLSFLQHHNQQPQQKQPLLIPSEQVAAQLHGGNGGGGGGERGRSSSWISAAALGFLTINAGMAIYRSGGDPWSVAFVLFSYCNLTLLFACLRMYEHDSGDQTRSDRLKIAVWLLTTTLTAAFSYKVAAIMPLSVAALVWAMAFATVAGSYCAFFVQSEK